MALGSRNWYALPSACLTLLGACFLSFFAYLLRIIDCSEESYSTCSTSGLGQFLIALAGIVPAIAMLTQSLRGRGHVGGWFLATVFVYGTWVLYLWHGPEFGAG